MGKDPQVKIGDQKVPVASRRLNFLLQKFLVKIGVLEQESKMLEQRMKTIEEKKDIAETMDTIHKL
ncbi:MAG: hypothetical protein WCW16_04455 [Candidatus Magasanikbacteria bacterium]